MISRTSLEKNRERSALLTEKSGPMRALGRYAEEAEIRRRRVDRMTRTVDAGDDETEDDDSRRY